MERGLLSLGSSMLYLQDKMNAISNNIANSDTNGYKQDKIIGRTFNSFLSEELNKNLPDVDQKLNSSLEKFKPGIYVDQLVTQFNQGTLESTYKNSDIAISGEGFISVDIENGPGYVRCASLEVDENGYLTIPNKGKIIGNNGYIRVKSDDYTIDESGKVYDYRNRYVGTIEIVDFENREALQKVGSTMFINLKGNQNIKTATGEIAQGKLETSNVDLTEQMIDMMDVSRRYETSQRAIQMLDAIYGLAANEIGKV